MRLSNMMAVLAMKTRVQAELTIHQHRTALRQFARLLAGIMRGVKGATLQAMRMRMSDDIRKRDLDRLFITLEKRMRVSSLRLIRMAFSHLVKGELGLRVEVWRTAALLSTLETVRTVRQHAAVKQMAHIVGTQLLSQKREALRVTRAGMVREQREELHTALAQVAHGDLDVQAAAEGVLHLETRQLREQAERRYAAIEAVGRTREEELHLVTADFLSAREAHVEELDVLSRTQRQFTQEVMSEQKKHATMQLRAVMVRMVHRVTLRVLRGWREVAALHGVAVRQRSSCMARLVRLCSAMLRGEMSARLQVWSWQAVEARAATSAAAERAWLANAMMAVAHRAAFQLLRCAAAHYSTLELVQCVSIWRAAAAAGLRVAAAVSVAQGTAAAAEAERTLAAMELSTLLIEQVATAASIFYIFFHNSL